MPRIPLRILHLEDNPADCELVAWTLRHHGVEAEVRGVAQRGDYLAALRGDSFDLILADYALPGYDGTTALAAARELRPGTPFIFVTGTLGEEVAVETLKNGASDYVLKTSLARLPSAVQRALREVAEARARRAADEAVRRSEETLSFALEAAGMGTWDWNIATGELVWSDRCKAIFGVPADAPMNYGRFLQALHPDDRHRTDAAVTRALAEKTGYDIECRAKWPDGSVHWIVSKGHAFYDPETGQPARMAGAAMDVTARHAAEEALRAARDAAERASKAKDEFLATLSHELRTPLTPVMLSAGTLQRDPRLPEEVREQLEMIVRNITLEARLIDDLLDLTRITRGHLALRLERCDVHVLLRQTREIVASEIAAKGLHFTADFAAAQPCTEADPTRLQQVFWNLLRNAIKFTPEGGHIRLTTRNDADQVIVEVIDDGIGIAPEMCAQIFEPFEQAGLANDHRFGGLGLGLSIANAIVRQHRGKISASSGGAGAGAHFRVALAGAVATEAAPVPAAELPAEDDRAPATSPLRLLIVEDHEPTLHTLSRLLARGGHHITRAASAAAALEAARAASFDVLISDLGLPDGTGYELFPRLRALHPALRAIVLSGYGTEEDLRKSREAGFFTHLTKPIDFAEVKRALHSLASAAS